jgi:hypothetical protein
MLDAYPGDPKPGMVAVSAERKTFAFGMMVATMAIGLAILAHKAILAIFSMIGSLLN